MLRVLRALRFGLNYFAAWIPVCAAYGALIYFQSGARSLEGAFFGSVFGVGSAAILGLGVWTLATRLAHRSVTGRSIAWIHVLTSAAYTTVWTALNAIAIRQNAPAEWPYFRSQVLGWHAWTGLFIYAGIASIAHVIESNRRMRVEREAAERAEALRARAELAALRSQLNPHFLFNTLHSIGALVRTEPAVAEQAIEELAGLLRQVLALSAAESDSISLAEEWSLIERQLDLERLRFGDRLRVVAQIDDDALDCAIPVLTLQPIVENAVRHGITPRENGGTIRILAEVENDQLRLLVEDDGVGVEAVSPTPGTGNGLRLVRQRLQRAYGDEATVTMESLQRGTRVSIVLPCRAAPARRVTVGDREVACAS